MLLVTRLYHIICGLNVRQAFKASGLICSVFDINLFITNAENSHYHISFLLTYFSCASRVSVALTRILKGKTKPA